MKSLTKKRGQRALLGIMILSLTMLATACGPVKTQPDQIGVHYSGGPFSKIAFASCIQPGTRKGWIGPGDTVYDYPIGQRTASFEANGKDKDFDPITVTSKDNVQMTVEGTATFDFTRDCNLVRQFHEQIGLKYQAWTTTGWNTMLETYVDGPLTRAMQTTASEFNYMDLYNNPDAYSKWTQEVSTLAPQLIKDQAGQDYFTDFNFTLKRPELSQDLVNDLQAQQDAIAQNNAQLQKNATIETENQAIQQQIAIMGPEAWAEKYAIDSGKVSVIYVPQGSNVAAQQK